MNSISANSLIQSEILPETCSYAGCCVSFTVRQLEPVPKGNGPDLSDVRSFRGSGVPPRFSLNRAWKALPRGATL